MGPENKTNTEETVFLEDLEYSAPKMSQGPSSSQDSTTSNNRAPSGSQKRQRTLEDMFTSNPNSSAKKLKLIPSQPRPSPLNALTKLNSIPFSFAAFVESLSDEHRQLLHLECETMGKSWLKLLHTEIRKPYFIALKTFLRQEGVMGVDDTPLPLKVYPPPKDIYSWSTTPLGRVKVVIIGQDPYHGPGQAHGLCFSVPEGVNVPPSLKNIFQELKSQYPEFEIPKHGNLAAWAAKGVLLLNTCLTVKARTPASHSKRGWETFTDRIVDVVDKYGGANLGTGSTGLGRGVVFIAWGNFALQRVSRLNKTKHLILTCAHPSPFSATKFFGNGHFRKANEWLASKYGAEETVDWCALDKPVSE